MSDTIKAVEDTLDMEDSRRQSAVSTAKVAQSTRLSPKLKWSRTSLRTALTFSFYTIHRM